MFTVSRNLSSYVWELITWPGKRSDVVTPAIVVATNWFNSLYVGVFSFKMFEQIWYKASLSMQMAASAMSTRWWKLSVALYGSVTVSDTFGEGSTQKLLSSRSGYSSRIFDINSEPRPDPVPPPSEWATWKPWTQSQNSASFRMQSIPDSKSSEPSV